MPNPYYVDLSEISLEDYRLSLETRELLPGRIILGEQTAERFELIASAGISNLDDLARALNSKKSAEAFARDTGLPEDYSIILRREVLSFFPKPVKLGQFPDVKEAHIVELEQVGIKHSKHLFERCLTSSDQIELAKQTSIPLGDLQELIGLSDLVRISGVGPVFARILYEAGVTSAKQLSSHTADTLIHTLLAVNTEHNLPRASFTERDVKHCIDFARILPVVELPT